MTLGKSAGSVLVLSSPYHSSSVNRGWDFATVLHSLAEIGYHIEYGLLNSRFHGVPQNRERIYLSLIDILEPMVDEKYFLSPQATAMLLYS